MLSDNETDKITTEEADRSLQIESWKLSKLKIKSIYNIVIHVDKFFLIGSKHIPMCSISKVNLRHLAYLSILV